MILITGNKGYIGTEISKKLPYAMGVDIKDGFNLLTCDLPKNVSAIIHLAAQTSVESSWWDPMHDADNLKMTVRLAKEYPETKIVYANSCASVEPKSPYGFSKKVAGDYLKTFHKNTVDLVFPNIYGGHFEKSVVDIFKDKKDVTVFGDGKQIRDYVHISDIVEGIIKALEWEPGTYFMGSEKGTTVLELAGDRNITFAPPRKEEREVVVKNTTPNWKPKINVLDYINDIL